MQSGINKSIDRLFQDARAALLAGKYRIAATHYRRLLRAVPDFPPVIFEGVRALTHLGEFIEARQILSAAAAVADQSAELWSQYSSAYFMLGDYSKAHELLAQRWAAKSEFVIGIALVEVCERLGSLEEALRVLGSLGKPHPRAMLMEGVIRHRLGAIAEAAHLLEPLARGEVPGSDPGTRLRASLLLALCYEKLGRFRDAWLTMTEAKTRVLPGAADRRSYDGIYRQHHEIARRSFDDFRSLRSDLSPYPEAPSPHLISGHPRSGNSVVSVHLAKALGRLDLDEIGGFMRAMEELGVMRKTPGQLRPQECRAVQKRYFELMTQLAPGASIHIPWLDKNPGMEGMAAYWLTIFPDSRIYLVQRHPLDCLISCLFTYLPLNPCSLQFLEVESAMASIEKSLEYQQRIGELAPERSEVLAYESFLQRHSGESSVEENVDGPVLHSPNYASARSKVHSDQVGRYRHYLEFLPDSITARWAD